MNVIPSGPEMAFWRLTDGGCELGNAVRLRTCNSWFITREETFLYCGVFYCRGDQLMVL